MLINSYAEGLQTTTLASSTERKSAMRTFFLEWHLPADLGEAEVLKAGEFLPGFRRKSRSSTTPRSNHDSKDVKAATSRETAQNKKKLGRGVEQDCTATGTFSLAATSPTTRGHDGRVLFEKAKGGIFPPASLAEGWVAGFRPGRARFLYSWLLFLKHQQ